VDSQPVVVAEAVNAEALRHELFANIVAECERAGIKVAVLNGFYGLGVPMGRDVDMLVARADLERALAVCQGAAEGSGWPYVTGRWLRAWWPKGLYQIVVQRLASNRVVSLAIDFICSAGVAAGCVTVYSPEMLSRIRPLGLEESGDVGLGYCKKLVQALAGHRKGMEHVSRHTPVPEVEKELKLSIGDRAYRLLEDSIRRCSLGSDWRLVRRRAIRHTLVRHPVVALWNTIRSAVRRVTLRFGTPVYTMEVLHRKNAGIEDLVRDLRTAFAGSFTRVYQRTSNATVLWGPIDDTDETENRLSIQRRFGWRTNRPEITLIITHRMVADGRHLPLGSVGDILASALGAVATMERL
jgi:hypothetical protein